MSIRVKILSGCLGLTLITVALGLYSQLAQRQLGTVASQIYDETVIAVSYLRSAQIGIGRIERELSQLRLMSETMPRMTAMLSDARADLEVAKGRAMSPPSQAVMNRIEPLLTDLADAIQDWDTDRVTDTVEQLQYLFNQAVDIYAADGFRSRQAVNAMVNDSIDHTWRAIGFAIVAALVITVILSRCIVPALRDAVRVAQSIASGRLDNAILATGRSETAQLLRALSAMQASIAQSLDHIRTLMSQQTRSHAGELAAHHARLEAALDSMSQGLCMFAPGDGLVLANKRFNEMFGAPTVGLPPNRMLPGRSGMPLLDGLREQAQTDASALMPDGRIIIISRRPVASGGWVATFADVTEQRGADAKLAHMARHDTLTGLPNRLHFNEHMPAALARARRASGLSVLCLDLDRFKAVNDTLGHATGDALLRAVAGRLGECTRETDLVARLGGDEFAIVQEPLSLPADAIALATRIVQALAVPFDLDGYQVVIGASVGIAMSDGAVTTSEALLKSADLALYRAKTEGRGTFRFFEKGMDAELLARRELELDLRRAVNCSELEVFYQPLMAAGHGIGGFEALVRWRHPHKGLVSPAVFIPVAEEIGLIGAIGGWVLQQATRDAATWPGALKVAVNLSPAQFKERTLVQQVKDALSASGLQATQLELEITESVLMQEDALALEMLHELRSLGVRIAMDDFGTGYSSLSYLRRFPFDKIKIDQSFVSGMSESTDCTAIIKAVIGLGRSLNMSVNAEGVETQAQFAALQREGCNEMQGYLFSKPQPIGEVAGMLERHGNATLAVTGPGALVLAKAS